MQKARQNANASLLAANKHSQAATSEMHPPCDQPLGQLEWPYMWLRCRECAPFRRKLLKTIYVADYFQVQSSGPHAFLRAVMVEKLQRFAVPVQGSYIDVKLADFERTGPAAPC